MKDADWFVGDVLLVEEARAAQRIEGNVGREFEAARRMHPLKTLQACVERGLATPRETHQRDPCCVDPWVSGQKLEGAVGIVDHRQTAQLSLVVVRVDDSPSGKGIDDKCCYAHRKQVLLPVCD